MVKLYYTPTSCGAASFIAAHTAGLNIEAEQVDLRSHTCPSGDFYQINPKGNVPTLVLDDGTILNENSATLQYVVDHAVTTKVGAAAGTSERYLLQNALSYIGTELHASVGGLFNPTIGPEVREFLLAKTATKLDYTNKSFIGDKQFVVGDSFTVADSYLYIILSWLPHLKVDDSAYPNIQAYFKRISELPNVKAAHARIAENPATVL